MEPREWLFRAKIIPGRDVTIRGGCGVCFRYVNEEETDHVSSEEARVGTWVFIPDNEDRTRGLRSSIISASIPP